MTLNVYLHFETGCRDAFEFYRSVFGGEFAFVDTFGNSPMGGDVPEDLKDNIMHIALPVGDSLLMGSDTPPMFDTPAAGTNFSISYAASSKEEADDMFAKLSDGGQASMPPQDMFWESYFGMCTDKYGISWMINFDMSQG